MKAISKDLRNVLMFTVIISAISVAYFLYAQSLYPPSEERETFLTEVGEIIGEIA